MTSEEELKYESLRDKEHLGRTMTKKDFGSLMKMLPSNCDKKLYAKLLQGILL